MAEKEVFSAKAEAEKMNKWPRIKWNMANAKLANQPFEQLFGEARKEIKMNEQEKTQLRGSLIEVLESWWDKTSEQITLPYAGPDSLACVADAALAVVFALQDTQEFLQSEQWLDFS